MFDAASSPREHDHFVMEHYGACAHRCCDQRNVAMESRWRFVLHPLSTWCLPRKQHVADECRADVVLCPDTRPRARENREYHTEQLREDVGHYT